MADKNFQVVMKVFAFDSKEAAGEFSEALTDAFMNMPVAEVMELPGEGGPNG